MYADELIWKACNVDIPAVESDCLATVRIQSSTKHDKGEIEWFPARLHIVQCQLMEVAMILNFYLRSK